MEDLSRALASLSRCATHDATWFDLGVLTPGVPNRKERASKQWIRIMHKLYEEEDDSEGAYCDQTANKQGDNEGRKASGKVMYGCTAGGRRLIEKNMQNVACKWEVDVEHSISVRKCMKHLPEVMRAVAVVALERVFHRQPPRFPIGPQ